MALDIRNAATGEPEDAQAVRPLYKDALFRDSKGKVKQAPFRYGEVADTHCHLAMLPDPRLALARAGLAGVSFIVTMADPHEGPERTYRELAHWRAEAEEIIDEICLNPLGEEANNKEDKVCILWSERAFWKPDMPKPSVPQVRISLGCHPHYAQSYDEEMEAKLLSLLPDPRTTALGEIGLDYHYDYSPRAVQREVFERQLVLAKECGLPAILHIREAHDDALAILRSVGIPSAGALLHCCNVAPEVLTPFVELGCMVAYGGPLTFTKADEVRLGALTVPFNRLLTETDAPFMTPVPTRGITCEPAHTVYTAAMLAELLMGSNKEEIPAFYAQLYQNAQTFLNAPPTIWQKQHSETDYE